MKVAGARDWSTIKCERCKRKVNRANAVSVDGKLYGIICALRVIAAKEKEALAEQESKQLLEEGYVAMVEENKQLADCEPPQTPPAKWRVLLHRIRVQLFSRYWSRKG